MTKHKYVWAIGAVALLLVTFLIGRWSSGTDEMITADPHAGHAHAQTQTQTQSKIPQIWTCSMHPQIQQNEPGQCPICGMDLIPLQTGGSEELGPRELSMSESAKGLAQIQTTEVQRLYPDAQIRLVGKLDYDETLVKSISARFPARVDRLYINYTGIRVQKGEHLAEVYSPELLTAQSELLTAHRYDPKSSTTKSAIKKLHLWDLLPQQVDDILKKGKASDRLELKAPMSGIVVHKNINEGDYVKTGESMFKIVDLSKLWVRLEAYESDLAWLKYGQEVEFSVESYPGETFTGSISFINPELNPKTRTTSVRVNVNNDSGLLKPGMFAKAIVKAKISEGGVAFNSQLAGKYICPMHPEVVKDHSGNCDVCGMPLVSAEKLGYVEKEIFDAPVVVPSSAVLRTGKRAIVYIEKQHAEQPTYEGREITLGARAGNHYIVKNGLSEGEKVVTKGAFKIDSALQIQAKPSMMNPTGGGPTPGHAHHQHSEADTSSSNEVKRSSIHVPMEIAPELLPSYFRLQQALANDDLEIAQSELKSMMSVTGHSGALADLLHSMLATKSLDEIRTPYFEQLSNALADVIKLNKSAFTGEVYQMFCPMANNNQGAIWLQASENLKNPYFGAAMLKCGEVQSQLNQ